MACHRPLFCLLPDPREQDGGRFFLWDRKMEQHALFDMPDIEQPIKPNRKNWRWAIPDLLEQNDGKCCVCGEKIRGTAAEHVWVEHIVPIALGGADELHNLSVSHPCCNMAKSDRMMDDPVLKEMLPKLRAAVNRSDRHTDTQERACLGCGVNIDRRGHRFGRCARCQREHEWVSISFCSKKKYRNVSHESKEISLPTNAYSLF